jgi:translation initiation factor eIF-2B subunit delta
MFKPEIQIMLNKLRKDNSSGASELINKALAIIESQLDLISNDNENIREIIIDLSRELIYSRPSMAPIINMIGYIISDMKGFTKKGILHKLARFGTDKLKLEKTLENNFQRFMSDMTWKNPKIMLISYSSTILNLLLNFEENSAEFYVLESRPLFEGRYTAETLSKKFKTHIIIDAAVGKFVDQIDLVLIGIDSVLKDGAVINKIGTYPLAVMANQKEIDVYAIGTSLKYNLKSHYGLNVQIEVKPNEEVYDKRNLNENLEIHNFYFDITPPKYIKGIISDLGILSPKRFLTKIKKTLPIEWFKLFLNDSD